MTLQLKIKPVPSTKRNTFDLFNTHWITLDFIMDDRFSHRKLTGYCLDDEPFFVNGTREFFVLWFENNGIRVMFDKTNDTVLINASDYALYAGYRDLNDLMADDNILDACNIIKKITGIFPIRKVKVKPIF